MAWTIEDDDDGMAHTLTVSCLLVDNLFETVGRTLIGAWNATEARALPDPLLPNESPTLSDPLEETGGLNNATDVIPEDYHTRTSTRTAECDTSHQHHQYIHEGCPS